MVGVGPGTGPDGTVTVPTPPSLVGYECRGRRRTRGVSVRIPRLTTTTVTQGTSFFLSSFVTPLVPFGGPVPGTRSTGGADLVGQQSSRPDPRRHSTQTQFWVVRPGRSVDCRLGDLGVPCPA